MYEIDNGPDTHISISAIHGYGLYASRLFEPGDLVIDYNLYNDDWIELSYWDLTQEQIDRGWFVMINDEQCITSEKTSKFSYLNHSRNPNCRWYTDKRIITAAQRIPAGTELTIDYRVEKLPEGAKIPSWY